MMLWLVTNAKEKGKLLREFSWEADIIIFIRKLVPDVKEKVKLSAESAIYAMPKRLSLEFNNFL